MKCQEERPGPQGQTAPPDHILMEMQVRIQLEQLRSSYRQVNNERDHLRLPCLVRENGCQTLQKYGMELLEIATSSIFGQYHPIRPKELGRWTTDINYC